MQEIGGKGRPPKCSRERKSVKGRKLRRILCPGTKRGNMCRGGRGEDLTLELDEDKRSTGSTAMGQFPWRGQCPGQILTSHVAKSQILIRAPVSGREEGMIYFLNVSVEVSAQLPIWEMRFCPSELASVLLLGVLILTMGEKALWSLISSNSLFHSNEEVWNPCLFSFLFNLAPPCSACDQTQGPQHCLSVCSVAQSRPALSPWTATHQAPCPWNFPGKNIGAGCHFLLQGIFLTQGSNIPLLHFLHWQVDSLSWPHWKHWILNSTPPEKSSEALVLNCMHSSKCYLKRERNDEGSETNEAPSRILS